MVVGRWLGLSRQCTYPPASHREVRQQIEGGNVDNFRKDQQLGNNDVPFWETAGDGCGDLGSGDMLAWWEIVLMDLADLRCW